jgi:hypothetical protein
MSDVQEKDQPKTKVTKLKIGGTWDYNVSFVQTFQEQVLKTNDRPRDSMTRAIENVVSLALQYVDIPGVNALLNSIAFGSNDDGENFTLILDVQSRENQFVYLTWGFSKIDREVKLNDQTLEDVEGFEGRNRLNEAVDVLEEEIKKYALGNRLQQELKIQDTPETKVARQQDFFNAVETAKDALAKGFEDQGAKVTTNAAGAIEVDFSKDKAAVK